MSRAFVNEDHAQPTQAAERRVSDQPNYVTPQGLALLKARLRDLQGPGDDPQRLADLHYFAQRVQSAQVVNATDNGKVQIGSWVTFADTQGEEQRVCLVGEDEADATQGRINWGSPLGTALLGARVGDEVVWRRPVGDLAIEIVEIDLG
ncbi:MULTISPECIES: GreA/GreB family elongation factor [Pseudomonas]|uniref:GreA/GreB family elongation factor n=1 Tax=Pseudomonas eucalypticola TaxID=2599595 RepID=A0A7D5D9G7_9PSED|nr:MULTISPECIES: GreA/GreB family elongation factor [Pseudomonas]QKZ06839.1 GreA/GreB family elongation factor [Pseudomonas eucalypticola]